MRRCNTKGIGTVISNYTSVIHIMALTIVPKQFTDQLLLSKEGITLKCHVRNVENLNQSVWCFLSWGMRDVLCSHSTLRRIIIFIYVITLQSRTLFCLANAESRSVQFRVLSCYFKISVESWRSLHRRINHLCRFFVLMMILIMTQNRKMKRTKANTRSVDLISRIPLITMVNLTFHSVS